MNVNQQCALAVNSANSLLGCINGILRRLRDSAFIRPYLHLALGTSNARMIMINWKKFSREPSKCSGS